ncbi:hypothetical protein M5689_011707 [Euphorbia peplus]|nr:hypothetical protein M5689_011707 [Euphorbia peplus]
MNRSRTKKLDSLQDKVDDEPQKIESISIVLALPCYRKQPTTLLLKEDDNDAAESDDTSHNWVDDFAMELLQQHQPPNSVFKDPETEMMPNMSCTHEWLGSELLSKKLT